MNKFTASIFFGACLVLTACTVHHYHHTEAAGGAKAKCKAHKSCKANSCKAHGSKGHHGLPEGHPPLDGHHGMPEGHPPIKGHGSKGHHGMPEGHPPIKGHGKKGMPHGHPPMKGHHGMKGHGMKGHGMKGHGMHAGKQDMKDPFGDAHAHDAEHAKLHANLPPAVKSFHDSFAPVWHVESDAVRSTAACATVRDWEKLAKGVVAHKAQREQAVAYAAAAKTLAAKLKVVSASCRKKNASVQEELAATHDALHDVMQALAK